jgi:hypothetical protein
MQQLKGDERDSTAGPILRALFQLPPPRTRLEALGTQFRSADQQRSVEALILAVALRQADNPTLRPLAADLLRSSDEAIRLVGVIWIGEGKLAEHRKELDALLHQPGINRQLFECTLAALDLLDGAKPPDPKNQSPSEERIVRLIEDARAAGEVRRFALRSCGFRRSDPAGGHSHAPPAAR